MKLTIQNRVAKVDVEPNATSLIVKEFKTARANVQEVRLGPRLRFTVGSATREEHSY